MIGWIGKSLGENKPARKYSLEMSLERSISEHRRTSTNVMDALGGERHSGGKVRGEDEGWCEKRSDEAL